MRAMILAVSSKDCKNLLNGDLSVLVRKKFPSDYVGWVYIYCMKARPYLVRSNGLVDNIAKEYDENYIPEPKKFELYNFEDEGYSAEFYDFFNGKVVGRFWRDRVEEIVCRPICGAWECYTKTLGYSEIAKASCLENREIVRYLKGKNGCAIHIINLEILDTPKEISEFGNLCTNNCERCKYNNEYDICNHAYKPLTHAPKTYCYIEI